MNCLKNAPLETILDAVERAVPEEDRPILADIGRQIGEYESQSPYVIRAYGREETHEHVHGFTEWIWLLQDGAASLPDRAPRAILLAWRDGYESNWKNSCKPWCPHPFWRCADCLMVLPNSDPLFEACPVCGSGRLFHADFSKRLGAAWIDPRPARRGTHAD